MKFEGNVFKSNDIFKRNQIFQRKVASSDALRDLVPFAQFKKM